MRAYLPGEKVLANCGTRAKPYWIRGEVVERTLAQEKSVCVRVANIDGSAQHWLSDYDIVQDTPRNRRKHKL